MIVSGIPAIEGDTEEAKIRWAFQQMQAHLEKAGATMGDVVELQSFHVAKDHEEFRRRADVVLKVHREFFKDHYPAWTAVGTTAVAPAVTNNAGNLVLSVSGTGQSTGWRSFARRALP